MRSNRMLAGSNGNAQLSAERLGGASFEQRQDRGLAFGAACVGLGEYAVLLGRCPLPPGGGGLALSSGLLLGCLALGLRLSVFAEGRLLPQMLLPDLLVDLIGRETRRQWAYAPCAAGQLGYLLLLLALNLRSMRGGFYR